MKEKLVRDSYFNEEELSLIHASIEGELEVVKDDGDDKEREAFLDKLFDKTLEEKPTFTDEEKEYLTEVAKEWGEAFEEEVATANSILRKIQ